MKKLGILSLVMAAAVAFCAYTGVKTKASYTDMLHTDDISQYKMMIASSPISFGVSRSFRSAYQVILKVKPTGNRIYTDNAYLSEVKVLQVYKGGLKEGENIWIYESVLLFPQHKNANCGQIHNMMNTHDEYYAFVVRAPYPAGYTPEREEYVAAYLDFSVLRVTDEPNLIVDDLEKDQKTIAALEPYEFVCTSKEELDEMIALKHQLFDELGLPY